MKRAIFFDIDNTLTETVSGETFKQHPRDVAIMKGVKEGFDYYLNQIPKWEFIGISNQGGVAAGFKSIEDAIAEMTYTLELLPQLSVIYFCPDFDGDLIYKVSSKNYDVWDRYSFLDPTDRPFYQSCRKPSPGMIQKAHIDFDIDLTKSWMIGDRDEDEKAANASGVNFMWADIWHMRFTPGMYEIREATPQQVEFLEGINLN